MASRLQNEFQIVIYLLLTREIISSQPSALIINQMTVIHLRMMSQFSATAIYSQIFLSENL
jgi:hypothetical protein